MADPAEIEAVLKRFSAPRLSIGAAIASDGKRIRGANRNGEGHHETATLVEHETGLPVASHGFHDESGEIAAVQALLEDVSVAGRVITVDALHTVRDTARSIVETHKADYLMTVKANAPETFATLETINWERDATGSYEEEYTKAHGRIELRRILTMTPLRGTVNYPHLAQISGLSVSVRFVNPAPRASKSPTASPRFRSAGGHRKNYSRGTEGIGRLKTETTVLGMSTSGRTPV